MTALQALWNVCSLHDWGRWAAQSLPPARPHYPKDTYSLMFPYWKLDTYVFNAAKLKSPLSDTLSKPYKVNNKKKNHSSF